YARRAAARVGRCPHRHPSFPPRTLHLPMTHLPMRDAQFVFDPAVSSAVIADGNARAGDLAANEMPRGPLTSELLDRMHRYWSAANYLTVGQIFLQDNPLL